MRARHSKKCLIRLDTAHGRALEADDKFFVRFESRRYRLRQASFREIVEAMRIRGLTRQQCRPGPGRRWYAAVRKNDDGTRDTIYALNQNIDEPDLPEWYAKHVFHEIEAADHLPWSGEQ